MVGPPTSRRDRLHFSSTFRVARCVLDIADMSGWRAGAPRQSRGRPGMLRNRGGPMVDPDLALLDRWCAGDADAGNQLFRRHFATVYGFFEHKVVGEVDDLVQETLVRCVSSRETFERRSTFRTYLFAVARRVL